MKKLTLICTALLLAGCDGQTCAKFTDVRIAEICKGGVVYLVVNNGGITPKINGNYDVYTCNQSANP
ncbi:hypothetical protein [Avibacterium paragallinarum]|uniref:Lipoprotein n=1 Tax=Avibacterium paragallinarum TaxID=728 RepID=A0A377I9B5_AVIPA|nr:hypothetical protein [Avibacterium paragallinarum]RZN53059.1 hypothetical protein EIG78_12615 [Avibacterium paragallinarum]RZN74507.1 hypothetical protein EC523_12215 [Avibacterium paragallinarum]RZN75271.1 hypothetical protein EC523_09230 [Avibacterium paragallinarum]RZN76394.1 hypothetical protein EC523_05240 [Avibacterium paragallinarum]RZN78213.1 hypothetical protein EC523_00910 [Avibacterium paragallinarum]